jgi:ribonucleotide monophosphatase NagD (HAD superfamily)
LQPKFGLCFDVDGVLARGTLALEPAVRMVEHLKNEKGEVQVPIVFVTNSLNKNADKANQIANWFGFPVSCSLIMIIFVSSY